MDSPDSLTSSSRTKTYATSGALSADVAFSADSIGACRAIRVGTAGHLKLVYSNNVVDTIYNVQVGELLMVQAIGIVASGTTAQQITIFP